MPEEDELKYLEKLKGKVNYAIDINPNPNDLEMQNYKCLLDEILNDGTISIKKNVKEPITVSRNTNLNSCLELLHSARAHMALVSDKENNFLGIVTMEDIINELMKS